MWSALVLYIAIQIAVVVTAVVSSGWCRIVIIL